MAPDRQPLERYVRRRYPQLRAAPPEPLDDGAREAEGEGGDGAGGGAGGGGAGGCGAHFWGEGGLEREGGGFGLDKSFLPLVGFDGRC